MNSKGIIWTIVIIIILIVIGIFVFGKGSSTPATTTTPDEVTNQEMNMNGSTTDEMSGTSTTVGVTASSSVSVGTGKTDSFTVTGSNFSFTPATLTVKKGDTVKITFKNSNGFHDFKIDEFNVATPQIQSGQEATVTFVANKTGTFQYYCSVGNHRAMGMWGTLTVTE